MRYIALALLSLLTGCYGSLCLPFTSRCTGGQPDVPREDVVIRVDRPNLWAADSAVFTALRSHPDTVSSVPGWAMDTTKRYPVLEGYLWSSKDTEIVSLSPKMNGHVLLRSPGKDLVCASLLYTYLPLGKDLHSVDYSDPGYGHLWVRHGSAKPNCIEVVVKKRPGP